MIIICPDCGTKYDIDASALAPSGRAVRCSNCGCEWYQIAPAEFDGSEAQAETAAHAARAPLDVDWGLATPSAASATSSEDADAPGAGSAELSPSDASLATPRDLGRGAPPVPKPGAARAPGGLPGSAPPSVGAAAAARAPVGTAAPARVDAATVEPAEIALGPGGAAVAVVGPRRSGLAGRAAAFIGLALLVQAAIGLYYFGPQIAGAAPGTSGALSAYRSQVDGAFAWVETQLGLSTPGDVVFVDYGYDLVEDQDGRALLVWGRVANTGDAEAFAPEIEIVSRDGNGQPLQSWRARVEADALTPGESARFASRMMFPLGPVREVDLYFVER